MMNAISGGFFSDAPGEWPVPPSGMPWDPPLEEFPYTVTGGPLLLGRTPVLAVGVTCMLAFRTGFELLLSAQFRMITAGRPAARSPAKPPSRTAPLRIGVQYSDGRKVATGSECPVEMLPTGLVLRSLGSGGGVGYRYWRYWLWPLPPLGPVTFVCEWPAFGLPECRAHTDAQQILEAATRSISIWRPAPPAT